ncbi:protein Skeletor, isoforms B/C isoform X2 [Dermatophagoides farinae]|uniref:protein Skeletor, isoforms B/C isoform X2 n=1 Tax=Dermatophagoides farinae TaxID=6954 RepID=UPI003F5E797C
MDNHLSSSSSSSSSLLLLNLVTMKPLKFISTSIRSSSSSLSITFNHQKPLLLSIVSVISIIIQIIIKNMNKRQTTKTTTTTIIYGQQKQKQKFCLWPPPPPPPLPLSSSSVLSLLLIYFHFMGVFINNNVVHCQSSSNNGGQLVTDKYYGTPLGPLSPGAATGHVYASDENTIFIKGFNFDGTRNPYSYFQAGSTLLPDGTGFTVADDKGTYNQLGNYQNKDLILKLPDGRTIREIRWFSVWNRNNHLSMGHVTIPVDVDLPRPLELPGLNTLAHGVRSSPITIVDAQTILIPNFWYDGLGPAAYWWATRGPRQSPQGLRLKDEKGSVRPLRAYHGETVMLMLPDTKTVYDFDWLGIWCEDFQVDFGHVHIPQHVRVPPSPAMLGLKPEAKLNCEVFDDLRGFEMRWILDGDDIVIQLVGRMLPNEYMSIGWPRDDSRSLMIGADSLVAWIDASGKGHAKDYYISAKEPCVGQHGVCPDLNHPGATDSITLLHAAVINGFRMITVKRPQLGVDERLDQHIYSDGQQAIIWAYGPLNSRNELSYHTNHQYGNRYLDFARSPKWNCPSPDQALMQQRKWQQLIAAASNSNQTSSSASHTRDARMISESSNVTTADSFTTSATLSPLSVLNATTVDTTRHESTNVQLKPWTIPKIICPKDGILWAQMGPVGGPKRGYQARTGHKGWGVAWYINGLMIPELVLKRGTTYTFWVEGGNDHENNARRHPLYLTTSDEGGFEYKTPDERRLERVMAGVGITPNGTIYPIAEGRSCKWHLTSETNINDIDNTYPTFEDFRKTLALDCDTEGQSARLQFTPDQNTPDLIYYQCYLHRFMGWKIHIVDRCPNEPTTSESKSMPLASSSSSPSRVQVALPLVDHIILPKAKADMSGATMIIKPVKNRLQNLMFQSTKPIATATNMKPLRSSSPILKLRPKFNVVYPASIPQMAVPDFEIERTNNISPLMSSAAVASPGTFMLQNFDNLFDPFMENSKNGVVGGGSNYDSNHRMTFPISVPVLPPGVTNPYNSPFLNFHQSSTNPNLVMKKFGVRFPNNNNNNNNNNVRTTISTSQAKLYRPQSLSPVRKSSASSSSSSTTATTTTTTTMKPIKSSMSISNQSPSKSVLLQSGGFVPIVTSNGQNKYNQRISWPSLTMKSKSRNKFNNNGHLLLPDIGFGSEDILRIRPVDSMTTTTATTMTTTTTSTTTMAPPQQLPMMTTMTPPLLLKQFNHTHGHDHNLERPSNSFVDRKVFSSLEYSNGFTTQNDDTDDLDSDSKPLQILQSSASSLVPKFHHLQSSSSSSLKSNNVTIDQMILMDVMRMIARDLQQQPPPPSSSLSSSMPSHSTSSLSSLANVDIIRTRRQS